MIGRLVRETGKGQYVGRTRKVCTRVFRTGCPRRLAAENRCLRVGERFRLVVHGQLAGAPREVFTVVRRTQAYVYYLGTESPQVRRWTVAGLGYALIGQEVEVVRDVPEAQSNGAQDGPEGRASGPAVGGAGREASGASA